MSARKLLLLVAILTCGALIEVAHGVRDELEIGPTGCRVLSGRFYGPSFEFDSQASLALEPGAGVLVENAFGSVVVRGGDAEGLRAKLRTRVYAPDRERAKAFADRVELRLEETEGRLRVHTNRDALTRGGERTPGFETELELEVPAGTAVDVRSHHARVALSDVGPASVRASYEPVRIARASGAVRIHARHGRVTLASIDGAVDLDSSHGDVVLEDVAGRAQLAVRHAGVRARGVAGLDLKQDHGDLEASEIAGDLVVEGSHAAVRVREVTGAARVETSYGAVRLESVAGDVEAVTRHAGLRVESAGGALTAQVSDGRVDLVELNGPLRVKTRRSDVRVSGLRQGGRIEIDNGDAELRDHSGALEVRVRLGDVRLHTGGPVEAPLTAVTREAGSVLVELDPGAGFRLEAAAPRGDVRIDVPGFVRGTPRDGTVEGTVGDASVPISLRSHRGDVVVTTSESR